MRSKSPWEAMTSAVPSQLLPTNIASRSPVPALASRAPGASGTAEPVPAAVATRATATARAAARRRGRVGEVRGEGMRGSFFLLVEWAYPK